MKQVVVREVFVFFVLFVLLTVSMHYRAWIGHPIELLKALPKSPFGIWHPLIFTLFFYILVAIVRVAIHFARRFKAKKAG